MTNISRQSGSSSAPAQPPTVGLPGAPLEPAVPRRFPRQVSRTRVRLRKPVPNPAPPCAEFARRAQFHLGVQFLLGYLVALEFGRLSRSGGYHGVDAAAAHQHFHLRLIRGRKQSVENNRKE